MPEQPQTTRLNNAQRKALAELVNDQFSKQLAELRDKESLLEAEITKEIVNKFKVQTIVDEIANLEKKVNNLKSRLNELGIATDQARYIGNQYIQMPFAIVGGPAKKLLEAKVGNRSQAIRQREIKRDEIKTRIWLAKTDAEAQQIVEEVKNIK